MIAKRPSRLTIAILLLGLGLTASIFLLAANYIDLSHPAIAFDWKIFWNSARIDHMDWGNELFFTPPWAAIFLLPLTALSFTISWAMMLFLTTLILIGSVPRLRRSQIPWAIAVLLLMVSHPVIRNYADVNVEAFTIAGLLLTLYAYHNQKPYLLAFAVLVATIKPQTVLMLMPILGLYMLQTFQRRDILRFLALVVSVLMITMLWGGEAWLSGLGGVSLGVSMRAALIRIGLPDSVISILQIGVATLTLFVALRANRRMSRTKAGMLIAASLLVTPFANTLSSVTLLAIGVIAFMLEHPRIGLLLVGIYNLPYLQLVGIKVFDSFDARYWLFVFGTTWLLLIWQVYKAEVRGAILPMLEETINHETESQENS